MRLFTVFSDTDWATRRAWGVRIPNIRRGFGKGGPFADGVEVGLGGGDVWYSSFLVVAFV